ncbi:MAG TPA: LuxR C-terminal-related transcriptional regulator [Candidatus Limnocylindrales bacterium]|jgi:DNA-binding CsgD family transcriptional regulator|nr:LuxR C-terminal-related transcriptional regulator [Candidatus Limnocylindrales bacterium]
MQADMMQECLFHLWITEREKPNQTRSWYLQSCRFHVQHYLASGRSLDNPRRAESEVVDSDGEHPALSEYHTDGELFESICFQDTLSALKGRLSKRQLAVLSGLVNGQTVSEIASAANLSYPTVLKYRNLIAGLTTKLGIAPRTKRGGAKAIGPDSLANPFRRPGGSRPNSWRLPAPEDSSAE